MNKYTLIRLKGLVFFIVAEYLIYFDNSNDDDNKNEIFVLAISFNESTHVIIIAIIIES